MINNINQPKTTLTQPKRYKFTENILYSGYISNLGTSVITIDAELWSGELFTTQTLQPGNSIIIIDMPFFILTMGAGTFEFNFAGHSYIQGEEIKPKISILSSLISTITNTVNANITNIIYYTRGMISFLGTTSATPNTATQITTTNIWAIKIVFVNMGTATIYLGDVNNQFIPISAGGIFILDFSASQNTNTADLYVKSGTANVPFGVLCWSI